MADENRKSKITLEVEATGAKEASKEIASIGNSVKSLNKSFKQTATDGVQDLVDTVRNDLNSALDDSAKKAADIQPGGGSGGGAPAAAKFRGAASLIGGGDVIGLIDDLQDLGEGLSKLATEGSKAGTAIVGKLSPAIGESAASALTAGAAFGVATAAIAVIGAALKAFADEQQKNADTINSIVEAQRTVGQDIAKGATTADLQKRAEELKALREDEGNTLERLKGQYKDNIDSAGLLTPVLKAVSGAEDGLSGQIDKSTKLTQDYDNELKAIESALGNGKTAANDMKAAEEELEKQRSKEASDILSRAQLAGQAIASQRKALDATEEQNRDRLDAIEDEKAAVQAQIDVLQSSGNTSEAVAGQIEKLNAQLGNLGQESQFINDTALAVSRQRDAEKKAAKDAEKAQQQAEQNAEKAADAQNKYNDSIKNAGIQLKQATQDINTKLGQTLADNLTGLFRDAADISEKFRRDTFDQDVKAQRDERDALVDHYRDLEDIRDEARKNEQEALRDGDFKQAFLARQQADEETRDNQRAFDREAQDRNRAQEDERTDLLRNSQRERADRQTQYDRQNADARLAASRELAQAQLARQRSLSMAADAYSSELRQLGAYLQARNQLQQQANQQSLAQMGIPGRGIPGTGISGAGIPGGGISGTGLFQQVISR